ncbi:hypothetical protein JRO89_XS09G0166900 [Xanthoceras sorbifolium]|uniref:Reverse transcriptase domain-containing protein n=1 Tax=Xanthoceras sorbifolium TaxID=99658 RepID=A0ABQ8HLL0_9ROSI|nr:hypothetical protein JRO89_XS09G0166900 [Xanthoceras sorbifolium]
MCSRRRYYWAGNGDFTMITAAFAMKINTSISVDISRPRPKSFKTDNPCVRGQKEIGHSTAPCVTRDMNIILDAKITGEEVRLAVFQMYPTKAPRIDGMTALFNQNLCDTIRDNVTAECLKCLNEGAVLDEINHALITLIPKVTTAQRVSDFGPIGFYNIIYESVAKALTNRICLVLGGVILENQSTFLPGHLITDNAIIAFECSYLLRKKKFGKKGGVALKIGKVMKCVTSVSLSFLVNGKPTRSLLQKAEFEKLAIVYGESGFVKAHTRCHRKPTVVRWSGAIIGMVICPFMVELDSAGVVNIVRSRISALSGVGLFTDRIIDKLEIPSFNSLVPRSANMAA